MLWGSAPHKFTHNLTSVPHLLFVHASHLTSPYRKRYILFRAHAFFFRSNSAHSGQKKCKGFERNLLNCPLKFRSFLAFFFRSFLGPGIHPLALSCFFALFFWFFKPDAFAYGDVFSVCPARISASLFCFVFALQHQPFMC